MSTVVKMENRKRYQVIISVIRSAHGLASYALSIMSMWRVMSGKFVYVLIQFY